jgi:hypothetical protein
MTFLTKLFAHKKLSRSDGYEIGALIAQLVHDQWLKYMEKYVRKAGSP